MVLRALWRELTDPGCGGRSHVLRTENLYFRTPIAWDLPAAQAAALDDDAQYRLGWTTPGEATPSGPARTRALNTAPAVATGHRRAHPTLPYGLVALTSRRDRYVGLVALKHDPGTCEVGGYLAPAFRGQGLGRELFGAGLRLAHEHLGTATVTAECEIDNVAATRSLCSIGFVPSRDPEPRELPNGRVVIGCRFRRSTTAPTRCRASRSSTT
ncbi:GNAT family N-acetyltransferase [Frankia sp. Mgl5]|uniref:GNAT family N-acetyltransferase n=1 Tax=Frankia sp. Mgl5 TaxID=2933793 RepID=UPI0034D5B597